MRAAVIDTLGTAPRVIAQPDPSPVAGNLVHVKVEAAALNAVDLHIASGQHRAGPPQLPYVPAIETVGTIMAGPDQGLRVRAATPAGLVPGVNGGMAEFLLTDRATCIPVPEELGSVAAAAIGAVGTSADLSLRKAGIQANDSVLVLGATGPLGTAAIQLARLAGATRVIAAGRNPGRLAQVSPAVDGVALLGEEPLSEQLASLGGPVDLVPQPQRGLGRLPGGARAPPRRTPRHGLEPGRCQLRRPGGAGHRPGRAIRGRQEHHQLAGSAAV